MCRSSRIWLSLAATVLASVAGTGAARADGILIESYGTQRPDDADAFLAPVRDELASRQYLTGPKLAERVDGEISEPATVLPEAELGRAARFVESGEKQSVTGDWKLAVAELARGVDLLLSAPVSMAQRQDLRDLLFAGLVALARAQARLGASEEARRWMAELLRTFPERELSRAKYPPDVHKLYREVRDQLASDGLGRLKVKTDSGVMVFVNERFVGLGEVDLGALPSGVYRVYLQRGDRRGRLHRVDVGSASDETLAIRWTLDGALRTDGGHVRFEFDGETERAELEAASTVEVARAVNASTVAVVGIREHDGRRAIVGSVLSMETASRCGVQSSRSSRSRPPTRRSAHSAASSPGTRRPRSCWVTRGSTAPRPLVQPQ